MSQQAAVLCSLGLAIFAFANAADACQCGTLPTLPASLERSVQVLDGTLVSKWPTIGHVSGGGPVPALQYTFRVVRVWKGDVPAVFSITADPSNCGFRFVYGRYLVFVERSGLSSDAPATVSICGATALVSTVAKDLEELGPGRFVTAPGEPARETTIHWLARSVLAAWIVGYLGLTEGPPLLDGAWLSLAGVLSVLLVIAAAAILATRRLRSLPWTRRLVIVGSALAIAFNVVPIWGFVQLYSHSSLAYWFRYLVE